MLYNRNALTMLHMDQSCDRLHLICSGALHCPKCSQLQDSYLSAQLSGSFWQDLVDTVSMCQEFWCSCQEVSIGLLLLIEAAVMMSKAKHLVSFCHFCSNMLQVPSSFML